MDEHIRIDFHHHIHFPQSEPGHLEEILTTLREMKEVTMPTLQDTINELAADDTELAADVNALVSIINDIPARIQAAVVDSLTKAGVSDAVIQTSLQNVDVTVQTAIAAAKAALPVPAGTDTTSGGDTTTNTLTGGNGTDTLLGGNGTDTLLGGNGDDTVLAGGGTDTIVGGQGSDTLSGGQAANGPAVLPPSSGGSTPAASGT